MQPMSPAEETFTTEELRDLTRKALSNARAKAKAEVKITHHGPYRPPMSWVVELESHRSDGCKFQVNFREMEDENGEYYEIEDLLEVYLDGSVDVHKDRDEFSNAILMAIEDEIMIMNEALWKPTKINGYDAPITDEVWR